MKCRIVNFNKQKNIATIQLQDKSQKEVDASKLQIRSEIIETYQDMVNMDILNEPELLENLKLRFQQNYIYTYVGPTLIAINPFKAIDKLYDQETLNTYFSIIESASDKSLYKQLQPHVFGITAQAYKYLFENNRNQALIISGESGAGKTENAKYCMKFLTSLGQNMQTTQEKLTGIKDLNIQRRKFQDVIQFWKLSGTQKQQEMIIRVDLVNM
ncbi:myosin head, putative [Ichthyophthirius multifiliis]|uniref:Myosin head, putative n=1 Tax=Ichthyophthirius multifiliis TaxID=5932 RepID=G0QKX8_ICHMU|nr:myosin head, putative [Ichthyophthirius multifiliis]EGR34129.1 myosin head, putative [Ichthyophthirius multifiliis]|eukprot:XP_004039433.1 myosin head, putative [Ichthyophthirius multifiliis]